MPGSGERCRQITLRRRWDGYVGAIGILRRHGAYDSAEPPEVRWTEERVGIIVHTRKPDGSAYSRLTVRTWLVSVLVVVRVLEPNADVGPLVRALARVRRIASRTKPIRDPAELKRTAIAAMKSSLPLLPPAGAILPEPVNRRTLTALLRFRDGVQALLLAYTALRLKNVTQIEHDDDAELFQDGDRWWLTFSRDQMKNRRAYDRRLPPEIVPWLEVYLDRVRPQLVRGRYGGDRLWVTMRGRPQTDQSIRKNLYELTGISPHRFRDSIATHIATVSPADAGAASWALADSRDTVAIVYNQAGHAPARCEVVRRLARLAGWDDE